MAGQKVTKAELDRTLKLAEALHALAVYDVDFQALEQLINECLQKCEAQPGNYGYKHRLRLLIGLRAWRRLSPKDMVQFWY